MKGGDQVFFSGEWELFSKCKIASPSMLGSTGKGGDAARYARFRGRAIIRYKAGKMSAKRWPRI